MFFKTKSLKIIFLSSRAEYIQTIKRMIRTKFDMVEVIDFSSPIKAKDYIAQNNVDIIISDSGFDSFEPTAFLRELKEQFPFMLRILIVPEWTKEIALETIDFIHFLIEKDSLPETMVETVYRAIRLRILLRNDELRKIISGYRDLPVMHHTYLDVLREMQMKEVSLKRIGEIIAKDISLTTKVLQVSNMAFFSHLGKLNTPQQAVVFLGINVIRSLVLYAQVFSFQSNNSKQFLNIHQLEKHSINTGFLAKKIAVYLSNDKEVHDDAFSSGLLHDIGKLIIYNLKEKSEAIASLQTNQDLLEYQAEYEILHTTHAEIGAYLLGIWGFPNIVLDCVAFHHQPSKLEETGKIPLLSVHIANALYHNPKASNLDELHDYIDFDFIEESRYKDKIEEFIASYHSAEEE